MRTTPPPVTQKKSNNLIIIPAYNEESTIEEVVNRSKQYADVCVIDDNSSDATPLILKKFTDIHVIHHTHNTHIPGGLMDGMRYAVEQGYEYAISMDAGLSHNPDEIPKFIQHPQADIVIGVRILKIHTPPLRRFLSTVGNLIYNVSLDFPISICGNRYYKDITSGFRRYSQSAMLLLLSKKINSRSFDILFETVMYIYRNKLTIEEVPITYNFSNSSLSTRVVQDCIGICLKMIIDRRK